MESLSFPFACPDLEQPEENDECDESINTSREKSLFFSNAEAEDVTDNMSKSHCKSPLFLRVLDHSLRSYDRFASWMVISSLCMCRAACTKLTTYMIDMSSVESTAALQSVFSDHNTLKIATCEKQVQLI